MSRADSARRSLTPIAARTHYSVLGVAPDAAAADIRSAYRRLARETHPDAAGESSSSSMADLNEAWRVLSDPARRAIYDASLRPRSTAPGSGGSRINTPSSRPPVAHAQAPSDRFPLKALIGFGVLAAAAILLFASGGKQGPAAPDWRIDPGSCVTILPNLDAKEAACDGPHDGVARQVVTFDTACPIDTVTHRDSQGMGNICVVSDGA